MTVGPFDEPIVLEPTEYGGDEGLIQPDPHNPTPAEQAGINIRANVETGIDPVTGRSAI